ncbi:MAG: SpoIIE family protein phosphatase, partial [Bacteroidales bacterium]
EEDKIYTFTRRNGFVGIETKDHASFLDSEGNMWFGTADGVTRYNPELLKKKVSEPLTHIKGMQVNYVDREMVPNMKLNHTEKSIIFDYYSICLTNPDAVKYQVKLEGAEEEWRPVNRQTRAIYSALSPNKYTFLVRAQNDAGVWNEDPISFHFVIKPPFYQTWWFILSCIIVTFAAILLFIMVRERNLIRENKILEEKVAIRTAEVVQKSKELEQKNKDITDSIRYAQRIQNAILPPENSFAETFILFQPKDIVSGDFYWLAMTETKQVIAAVDCTGHGVPGAFMSIIGYNSLNKIVKEYGFIHPAEILDHLNDEVSNTLQKQSDEDEVKDGMDIALLVYDFTTKELEYAGAYNPLYLVSEGELIEIKGDRFPIGRSSIKVGQKFTNHKIQLKSGDTTYVFSDGYADQFGGSEGKKFKSKAIKNMLLEIQDLSMEKQKAHMERVMEEWRGNLPQIDDILFIGSRVQ